MDEITGIWYHNEFGFRVRVIRDNGVTVTYQAVDAVNILMTTTNADRNGFLANFTKVQ